MHNKKSSSVSMTSPWRKAVFLHERKPYKLKKIFDNGNEPIEKAREWQNGMHIDDELFNTRLNNIGLSFDEFQQILVDTQVNVRESQNAFDWLDYLDEVVSDKYSNEVLPPIFIKLLESKKINNNQLPFEGFMSPFLKNAIGHLKEIVGGMQVENEQHLLLNKEIEIHLLRGLANKLLEIANRTLVLELNVARLKGLLIGDTPQERFVYFSKVYLKDQGIFNGILEEYPVLARLLVVISQRWIEATYEFFRRLYKDWDLLKQIFNNDEPIGQLTYLRAGLSDSHNGGRSVIHICFSSGLELIYKPKSLAVSEKFQELVSWLNNNGLSIKHRPIKISNQNDYGWVEFIKATGCEAQDEIKRFYWRQGSFLAILYSLNAVDFHYENLIAHGEYPVLVDLEALFHNDINLSFNEDVADSAYFKAWQVINQSVLRIGLLPQPVFSKDGRKSFDMSGLGGAGGQMLPFSHPMIQDLHTDEMRYELKHAKLIGGNNLPELKEYSIDPTNFTEEIVLGFNETYKLIFDNKNDFEIKINEFADVPVRQVLRMTRHYGSILQESYHPDYLRNGIARDMLLDKLWAQAAVTHPFLKSVVPSEHIDLLFGDVPFFSAIPSKIDLWDSQGERIPNFFNASSLSEVNRKLEQLNIKDKASQIDFIHKAMISLKTSPDQHMPSKIIDSIAVLEDNKTELLLQAAEKIGTHLQAEAILGIDDACWVGVSVEEGLDTMQCLLSPIGTSLYQGVGGISLFFAYLADITGRNDFKDIAVAALAPARKHMLSSDPSDENGIGAFTGRASLIYICHQLARLWGDDSLYKDVADSLPELEKLISHDEGNDILSGEAGAAIILLNLYKDTKNPKALELAKLCGQNILQNAKKMENGSVAWTIPIAEKPLAGFSHGIAGIVWALLELASATNNAQFYEVACKGLEYERSLYLPEYGNWLDIRDMGIQTNHPQMMSAWCHGAPGVVLGRLLSLPHLDNKHIRNEIEIGIQTTIKESRFVGSHSLCHGAMGNAEILYFAGDVLKNTDWKQFALDQAYNVATQVKSGNWLCGVPSNIETPGLMLGIAGIGMSFLHFYSPSKVPSVLRLQYLDL